MHHGMFSVAMQNSWTFACLSGRTKKNTSWRCLVLERKSERTPLELDVKVLFASLSLQEEILLHAPTAQVHEQVSVQPRGRTRSVSEEKLSFGSSNRNFTCRMEKRINKFRGLLPRKPMKFDSDTLPDLAENESFTAPFSRSRIHQWVFFLLDPNSERSPWVRAWYYFIV